MPVRGPKVKISRALNLALTSKAGKIMEKRPDAISIFIASPSFEALEARLLGRGDTAEDLIQRRLRIAREEYLVAPRYQYVVINDVVEDAVHDVAAILRADALRASRQKDVLNMDTEKETE